MITFEELEKRKRPIAVVGLGYVGLPLALALGRHFDVIGFDISEARVDELRSGRDHTAEVSTDDLTRTSIRFTSDETELRKAGVLIVAVPTPIDKNRRPELSPVVGASTTVGRNLTSGAVVAYESTVYPGLTEEVCVPLLEKHSGLVCGRDFSVGYSPERINPGDKVHTLRTIAKIVSGLDRETCELLAKVYGTVVEAGIHKASSIKVAEAAKVIENTQRDLNIALMNELSLIFSKMGIDTVEVLEAAGTKWNFLPFRPGLVGGHCIGVDPYYLTFKAEEIGFHPQVILAGRRINDSMGQYVAEVAVKKLIRARRLIDEARIGILGLTFKENVPDLRNTRVVDIVHELRDYCQTVLVHDPLADADEAMEEYGLSLTPMDGLKDLDAVILAVPHKAYLDKGLDALAAMFKPGGPKVLLDVKAALDADAARKAGFLYWRL